MIGKLVPKTYKTPVNCCATCRNVLSISHYDDPTEYYCAYKSKKPTPPQARLWSLSNSDGLSFSEFRKKDDERFEKQCEIWDKWNPKEREVSGKGKCSFFKKRILKNV
jgi:hypothetical protein